MGLPIIGDLLNSTVGKVVGKLVDKYLPPTLSDKEKEEFKLKAMELALEEEKNIQTQMEIVNKTIQAEIVSGNWFVSSWRPICGYTVALLIINNFIAVPYFKAFGLNIVFIEVPPMVWSVLLAVTGISAFTRGWEKVEKVKNGNK